MQTNMKNNNTEIMDLISSFKKKHSDKIQPVDLLILSNLAGELEKTFNKIQNR